MPETGLKVDDLWLARGGHEVLSQTGFSLRSGDLLELRGPNGVGKSSLLLALAGLIDVERGTIALSGHDEEMPARTLIHFLGHHAAIKPGLTVRENLEFWVDVLGGKRRDVEPALEAAGLGTIGGIDAGVLSAGQGRRLALARLHAVSRPVWLLDEPTSALDDAGAAWVGQMIVTHIGKGGIAVIATHLDIDYGPLITPQRLVLGGGR